MATNLFDTMNAFFDKKKYADITESEKRSHFFMIQRYMSIMQPVIAQGFNRAGMNYAAIVDYWARYMRANFNRMPQVMYTKKEAPNEPKFDDAVKEKIDKYDKELIKLYLFRKRMNRKDFNHALTVIPDKILSDLKKLYDFQKSASNGG